VSHRGCDDTLPRQAPLRIDRAGCLRKPVFPFVRRARML